MDLNEFELSVELTGIELSAFELFYFKQLIFIGDGDCPECGGEMVVDTFDTVQPDYDSEPEAINKTYKCEDCGNKN
jgi:hypothetical protein